MRRGRRRTCHGAQRDISRTCLLDRELAPGRMMMMRIRTHRDEAEQGVGEGLLPLG